MPCKHNTNRISNLSNKDFLLLYVKTILQFFNLNIISFYNFCTITSVAVFYTYVKMYNSSKSQTDF